MIKNALYIQASIRARFHYERGMEHSLFDLLNFLLRLTIAQILSAVRSIKETKNAPFHAHSENEPLSCLNEVGF